MKGQDTPVAASKPRPNLEQENSLSDRERRDALAAIGRFAKYTGPGIALLLASEQAVASGGSKDEEDCPWCS